MTGNMQRDGLQAADVEAFTVLEEMIELPPIAGEIGAGIEQFSEGVLHPDDVFADRQLAAEGGLKVGRRRQMVGVDMSLQLPDDFKALGPDVGDHRIGRTL